VWTKTADQILAKANRQATSATDHYIASLAGPVLLVSFRMHLLGPVIEPYIGPFWQPIEGRPPNLLTLLYASLTFFIMLSAVIHVALLITLREERLTRKSGLGHRAVARQ
jgi:hypothetical protein